MELLKGLALAWEDKEEFSHREGMVWSRARPGQLGWVLSLGRLDSTWFLFE